MDNEEIADVILKGGVGVLPTDTLYGLVGSARIPDAVSRIYELKQRDHHKPLIVLIENIDELEEFGVEVSAALIDRLHTYWPGPYSIILPTIDDQFEYLSRGRDTIAFRLPDEENLRDLLRLTGPLVAPSANPEGFPTATSIDAARKYFGTDAEFYVDGGLRDGDPSTLIELDGDEVRVLRG